MINFNNSGLTVRCNERWRSGLVVLSDPDPSLSLVLSTGGVPCGRSSCGRGVPFVIIVGAAVGRIAAVLGMALGAQINHVVWISGNFFPSARLPSSLVHCPDRSEGKGGGKQAEASIKTDTETSKQADSETPKERNNINVLYKLH